MPPPRAPPPIPPSIPTPPPPTFPPGRIPITPKVPPPEKPDSRRPDIKVPGITPNRTPKKPFPYSRITTPIKPWKSKSAKYIYYK